MKTIITEHEKQITISNDLLDTSDWVEISIKDTDTNEDLIIEVRLDDIFPALIGFDAQRSRLSDQQKDLI